jgi:capsular exopolysaccharide synthesis family protein
LGVTADQDGVRSSQDSRPRTDKAALEDYPRERRSAVTRMATQPPQVAGSGAPRPISQRQDALSFEASADRLIVSKGMPGIAREQYRRLAAAVHHLQTESGLKSLMVTSALPREGKTLTITNLALTLSELYKRRVLLIDADLRRPAIHKMFRLPNSVGLSSVLRSDPGEVPILEVSPLLSVLPAGRSDVHDMAGLVSGRFRALLAECTSNFDWVLLDAPPVGLMSDSHLLAGEVKAVLFVVSAGSTPYQIVERAIAEVGRECVVGTLLNRMDVRNIPATDYYEKYYEGSAEPSE